MRILLTNFWLKDLGGSETWTQTMAHELIRRGHDVLIYTTQKGRMADLIHCPVTTTVPTGPFDLILVNHAPCLQAVQGVEGLKVFTSHGPQHPLEQPIRGAHFYVGVSEEVRESSRRRGFQATVIRNPIDMERFQEEAPVYRSTKDALVILKEEQVADNVGAACIEAGFPKVTIAHYQRRPVEDMDVEIARHCIVIGGGRGILEALACNRHAFSLNSIRTQFGPRVFGDGWVTPDNILDLRKVNCSGRWGGAKSLQMEDVVRMLKDRRLTCTPIGWGREYIRQNNDVRLIAEKYLAFVEIARQKQEKEAVTA